MNRSRRRMVLATLGGGLAAAAVSFKAWRSWGDSPPRLAWSTHKSRALGAEVTITAAHATEAQAATAIAAAFAELERIEGLLSIYRPTSQVSQLNRDGKLSHADPALLAVLEHAQAVSRRSSGAFDITVQPLWELHSQAQSRGSAPTAEELSAARSRVDWRQVRINGSNVELRPGGRITLNGIAQGYAADLVKAVLSAQGVQHALVNAGEFSALGKSPRDAAWKVGVQHPREAGALAAVTALDGRALSTSGDYATTFASDYSSHHLFDPHTGGSPTELASVSVLAPSAMEADALSTAVFVLGAAAGLALVARCPGADVLLIGRDGVAHRSVGFPLVEGGAA